jgi:tRNA A-37 threonylcarbamoyl transferase component Bud32
MVPRRVGRYEIGREVGRGGMAAVYLARQIDLDRMVALKELRVFRTVETSFAQRFLREARLAGSFSHPNIVTVHDYFEHEGLPYIAMEYLPRGSLRRHVGRVSLAQAGGVLEGVLAGLAHAEQRGVVHRDIKPENLLVTAEGGVKIADFGIAKATVTVETGGLLTATGTTVGTPNYIAPEQAMARELGPWTDLYSVGVTAFELFVGRAPFADTKEPMAIVLRQINEPVPRLSDVLPNVDRWISDWVAWLVSKNPAERPQVAAQAWDALEEALIAQLGPRWRHGAQLREPGEQPTGVRGRAGRPSAAEPVPAASPEPTTRRVADPRLAATVPPHVPVAAAAPAPGRRVPTSLKLLAAAAALAVAGLALAGRQGAPVPTLAVATDAPPSTAAANRSPSTAITVAPEPVASPNALADRVAPAQALARTYERAAGRIANRPKASASEAKLVKALRQIGRNYRAAGAAAARGDLAAYSDALTAADSGRDAVAGRLEAAVPSRPKSSTAAGSPTPAQPAPSPCAGDSASDDPSDDACGE